MNCIVKDCPNKNDEGFGFILEMTDTETLNKVTKWICYPCYQSLVNPIDTNNQNYHNMLCLYVKDKAGLLGWEDKNV